MATNDPTDTAAPEAPAKTPRRRSPAAPRKKAAAAVYTPAPTDAPEPAAAPAADAPTEDTAPAKAPARRRRKPATEPVAEASPANAAAPEVAAAEPEAPGAEPAPARKSRSRRRPAPPAEAAVEPVAEVVEDPAPLAAAEPTEAPQPPEPPLRAAITLNGAPVFVAGRHTGDATLQRLARWQDADGTLRLPGTDALMRLLDELGEAVDVDEAVWALLARRGDLQQRIDHLGTLYPQGLEAVALPAADGLRACQREGAFYAACVGSCALADDAALQPERQLALAWQLVQRHFGAERLALQAPPESLAGWQALLGEAVVDAASAEAAGAEVLLVDARAGLPAVPVALPERPWTWVLLDPAALNQPDAAAWLHTLDRTATGAVAAWQARGDESALAPLLLRRRFADVADQWPAWSVQEGPVSPSEDEAAQLAGLLSAMRAGLARWQRSGFLSDSEQLALLRQRRASEQLARAAAAGALVPAVQRALADGAQRVLVFTADADLVAPLTEVLQGEYLPAQALPGGDEADALLRGWRDAEGPRVLVLADEAGGPRIATHPHRPVLILLDGASDDALRQARLARVRVPRTEREVPVWSLRVPGWPGLPAAPARALLRGAELAAWLEVLQAALRIEPPAA